MVNNYHTHTRRCHHASGTDREMIEAAIRAGVRELGFSDHCPYNYPGDYYPDYKMEKSEIPGYFASLIALKKEYEGKILLHIGFEAEYYPALFEKMQEMLAPYPYEYLILGQHFTKNETDGGAYSAGWTDSMETLTEYTDQVIEGLETGKFSYLAHPDILNYQGEKNAAYRKNVERLCETAKRLEIPLELNFIGLSEGRNYPCEDFFRIAGEIGTPVIFGRDAHHPGAFRDAATEEKARYWCRRFGLRCVDRLVLRNPK